MRLDKEHSTKLDHYSISKINGMGPLYSLHIGSYYRRYNKWEMENIDNIPVGTCKTIDLLTRRS